MSMYSFLSSFRWLVRIKQMLDSFELQLFRLLQLLRKYQRNYFQNSGKYGNELAIVCVKRPEYVNLAIDNINSLQFHNSNHRFTLYMDQKCLSYFRKTRQKLHYPEKVKTSLLKNRADQPWTLSKVDALISASKQSRILTDADGIWRSDVSVDKKKVVFLVKAYKFLDNEFEKKMIEHTLGQKKWLRYTHYVTGFVSIPSIFMTKELERDCKRITKAILTKKFPPMPREQEESLRRLAEEIGVSLAVQIHLPAKLITTLKETDGPGNRKVLQSMYYGCANRIIN